MSAGSKVEIWESTCHCCGNVFWAKLPGERGCQRCKADASGYPYDCSYDHDDPCNQCLGCDGIVCPYHDITKHLMDDTTVRIPYDPNAPKPTWDEPEPDWDEEPSQMSHYNTNEHPDMCQCMSCQSRRERRWAREASQRKDPVFEWDDEDIPF